MNKAMLHTALVALAVVIIAQNLPVLQDYVSGQKRFVGTAVPS